MNRSNQALKSEFAFFGIRREESRLHARRVSRPLPGNDFLEK
jgi:hypothetical protein